MLTDTFYFLVLLFAAATASAQVPTNVTEGTTEYDRERLASQTISLDAPVDAVYEPWQEFWDDRYGIDIDRTDKDGKSIAYLAEDVNLADISSRAFDLYSNVDGTDKVSTVSISVAIGDDLVVTRNNEPASFRAAAEKLREFRTYFYNRYFDERIAAIRDELEDARDARNDASDDAEKARKKIRKYEDKIADLRERIEKTREEVGDELEAAEESERRVSDLEEELRRLQTARSNYVG